MYERTFIAAVNMFENKTDRSHEGGSHTKTVKVVEVAMTGQCNVLPTKTSVPNV